MATIEIFQLGEATEDEPIEKIEIAGIDPLRIIPVNEILGNRIPMTELSNFITKIKPIKQSQQEELDRYYVECIPVYEDGDLSCNKLSLPHHIGLRVVLKNILQKYSTTANLEIRIS